MPLPRKALVSLEATPLLPLCLALRTPRLPLRRGRRLGALV